MSSAEPSSESAHDRLKSRHRLVRDEHAQDLSLRLHRALSWLQRAEMAESLEPQDSDAGFIFYWIAFNAAYAEETAELFDTGERSAFNEYFDKMIRLDTNRAIFDAIWEKFSGPIRLLLDNRYVFQPFWKHQNGTPGYEDWERRFGLSRERARAALANMDTLTVLTTLFDRLYVLRNQLIHGGATWNSSVNRSQVDDGARIMAFLVPVFIELMMDNPTEDWGRPYYPVVD